MTADNLPPWARMALGYDGDPKVAGLAKYGDDAGLCRDLHLAMIRYCRRNGTDGLVPPAEPSRLAWPLAPDRAMQLTEHLVEAELITPHDERLATAIATAIAGGMADVIATAIASAMAGGMATGWEVANYAKWQETSGEVEAYTAAQSQRGRLGAQTRWKRERARRSSMTGAMAGAVATAERPPDGQAIWRTDGDPMAEREVETESVGPARNAGAGAGAGANGAEAEADDRDRLIQAMMHTKTGQTVTRDEAAEIWISMSTGRTIGNPAAWIRKCLATKADARKYLPHRESTGTGRSAADIIAATRRPGGPTRDVGHWAEVARKGLHGADNPPEPEPEDQADPEHDPHGSDQADEHDDDSFPF
jgi:hypothetical protein